VPRWPDASYLSFSSDRQFLSLTEGKIRNLMCSKKQVIDRYIEEAHAALTGHGGSTGPGDHNSGTGATGRGGTGAQGTSASCAQALPRCHEPAPRIHPQLCRKPSYSGDNRFYHHGVPAVLQHSTTGFAMDKHQHAIPW
jgi:hypothetical protein